MATGDIEQFGIDGENQVDPARRFGRTSAVLALVSSGIFCTTWASMWGPVYLGLSGWLFLYPLFLLMLAPTAILAVLAIVFGFLAWRRYGRRCPRFVVWSLIAASAMLVVPLPALWFGNAPLVILGAN